MSANFSDLQSVDTANGADQMMLRLNNGATGPDGFARIEVSDLNSLFTSNLTASDANVKQLSAQWSEAYTQVSANSSVFALTVSQSGYWNAAYDAVTGTGYNFGIKEFDYVTINGPFDSAREGEPIFTVKRNNTTTADMVQVIPVETGTMFRITTAGSVGININENYTFGINDALYVNGNQRIDGTGGNALTINGDLFVNGSLSALSATYINSIVTNTSALSISSNGGGPALKVNQYDFGSIEPIAQFFSNAANIILKGNGDVTGFNNLSAFGRIIAGANNAASNAASYILGTNNNDNNNANVIILGNNISAQISDYTYVTNLSAAGDAGIVAAGGKTSVDWNNTYTAVNAQSAANASVYSSFNAQSANNASVYSTTNANSASWGGVGTAFNVVSAINTSALTAVGINANINAALVAKGAGATLAQIPDNAAAGGNARGLYATDWQKSRAVNTKVASGNYSTIGGGYDNAATAAQSTVGGGYSNTASGAGSSVAGGEFNIASGTQSTVGGGLSNNSSIIYSTIAGGYINNATGTSSTVGGGISNTASGDSSTIGGGGSNAANGTSSTVGGGGGNGASGFYSTIGGGIGNAATGTSSTVGGGIGNAASGDSSTIGGGDTNATSGPNSTIGGGYANTASGQYATVGGGYSNTASGRYATVVGGGFNYADKTMSTSIGYGASATNYGEIAAGGGYFANIGDNKSSTFLLRTTTSGAGSAYAYLNNELFTPDVNSEITLPNNSTYAYTATIVGLSSHANSSGLHYILRGFAKNNAGVVTVYPATSDLTQRIPATLNAGMSAAGSKLRVVVYTPSGATHYWTARVQGEYIQF